MKIFAVLALYLAAVAAGPEEDLWLRYNKRMPDAYYLSKPVPKSPFTGRIVGGVEVDIEDFPYMLSLRRRSLIACGASVISTRWALSAAHCTYPLPDVSIITLRGGTSNRLQGGVVFDVDLIINHPQYNDANLANDVCVLRTVELMIGLFIAPIGLVPAGTYYPGGTRAVVSGWGLTSVPGPIPTLLQAVNIPVVDQETCAAQWADGQVTEDMLCASEEGRDACSGDSGGPLVTGGRQIGIVSWGTLACRGSSPGVFARVAFPPIRNWIEEVTGV
ncbi:trypsin-7-like [Topomyia yanbarensis]|uniref:trypsin-7-like n=1 Tax=Topomyia yanbarensis TaxID=2498891 RepID=UPI00273ADB99|nr:trypsin-7-like [Topomyia yanbarensis]